MSHVAIKNSEGVAIVPSNRVRSVGRALALITAVSFGLSACESMKETMDSTVDFFSPDEQSSSTTADANSTDQSMESRKSAVVGAGVDPISDDYVNYYMDQQEEMLRQRLNGTGVSVTRSGDTIILNMPGKTFASGSSNVNAKFHSVLDSVVLVLDEYNQTYIDIIGHTDSKGSKEYNQRLSEKRAKSVALYLEKHDVTPQRLMADGMGEDRPVATNDTTEGRAKNRRVEIKLTPVT